MNTFYNEILTDHNLHPGNKHDLPDANYILEGVNPSCGDDIILKLRVEDGMVKDGAYTGDGCAISQASADIMLDLVIGKSVQEAEELSEIFVRMITGSISGEEAERLEEAGALQDISHMPSRVKCAVLRRGSFRNFFFTAGSGQERDFPSRKYANTFSADRKTTERQASPTLKIAPHKKRDPPSTIQSTQKHAFVFVKTF